MFVCLLCEDGGGMVYGSELGAVLKVYWFDCLSAVRGRGVNLCVRFDGDGCLMRLWGVA